MRRLVTVDSTTADVVSGVHPSYEQLFAAHFADTVRLAALLGADDPEDIAQEAFVRLHAVRLRDPSSTLAYVRRTTVNLCRSRLRHLAVVRRHRARVVDIASAEAHVLAVESQRELIAALGRIGRRQREILVLRYWLDLTESEIAATLGISVGGVKSNTFRAMQAMRRELGESG